MSESIILMGCKNTGKTSHGKELADAMQLPFLDTDLVIQKMKNMPYKDFYRKVGFPGYMLAEEEACEIIEKYAAGKILVISTGGNICDNPPALNCLRGVGKFVFMHLPLNYCVERSMKGIEQNELGTLKNLPAWIDEKNPKTLEDVRQIFLESYTARFQQYTAISDEQIELTGKTKEDNFHILYDRLK